MAGFEFTCGEVLRKLCYYVLNESSSSLLTVFCIIWQCVKKTAREEVKYGVKMHI